MTDGPKRLRMSSSDAMLAGLLDVARDERPSSAALQRTLLAVGGVGVALSAGSGSAAAATSVASSGAAASTASSGGVATGAGVVSSTGVSGAGISGAGISGAGISGAGVSGAGATIGTTSIVTTSVAAKLTFGTTVVTVGKWVGIGAVGIGVATQAPEWASDAATPSAATPSAATQNAATHVAIEQSARVARNPAAIRLAPRGELPSNLPSLGTEAPSPDEPHPAQRDESGRDDAAPNPSTRGVASQTVSSGTSRGSSQASSEVNASGATMAAQRGAREVIDPGGTAEAIAAEVSLVDRARGSLQSGSPQRALSLLAGYEQTFPRQQLIVEVVVLRMEATHALGQRNRAAGLARRVLEMHGGAPHASRAKEILRVIEQSEQRETEH